MFALRRTGSPGVVSADPKYLVRYYRCASVPFPCPVRSCMPRLQCTEVALCAAARTTVAASNVSVARRTAARGAARTMTRPLHRPTRPSRSAGRLATTSVAREGAERLLVARALFREGCIGQRRHLCFCHRPFFSLPTHRRWPCSSSTHSPHAPRGSALTPRKPVQGQHANAVSEPSSPRLNLRRLRQRRSQLARALPAPKWFEAQSG